MYLRPKPGEDEDDLLRMQEEFFQRKKENQIKPAATVVSGSRNESKADTSSKEASNNIQEQLANTFEAIPIDINLGNIVEKKSEYQALTGLKFNTNKGFPQAKRRDPSIASGKGSIFSKQFKKQKLEERPMEVDLQSQASSSQSKDIVQISLPSKSYILSGKDSTEIHESNLNVMKTMSETEIMEEREKLLSTMDPAIIAYLKSRRETGITENRNPTIKEQNSEAEDIKIDEIETTSNILKQPTAEKWLNFDKIESNKLAWMKNIEKPPKIDKNQQFEARFDFEGWLLPFSDDINEQNRALYHHGDEPGRPGYTLQELFQLARSSVIQQKIVALNTIANILLLNTTGIYDNIIDIPIEQTFFVLRFCLDDNQPAVLNASIKAMRNLFHFHIDETLLDSLLGFGLGRIQPVLAVDDADEDDNTVNDQHLAETNLVKCLARTEILQRIKYIINTIHPSVETVVYCMEILIRLCRDSQFIMTRVFNCDGLIESILKYFLPLDCNQSTYEQPLMQTVKFLRVLCSRSKHISTTLINKYKVMDSIVSYLTNENYSLNANGLKLQIECFHFWSLLINYGLTFDYFKILQPVLLKTLDYHLNNTDLNMKTTFVRQGHVSALVILLSQIVEQQFCLIAPFLDVIFERCAPKWIAQFMILDSFACGKLQIISSLLYFMACVRKKDSTNADKLVLNLVKSSGFNEITKNIRSGSMLLNNYETHKSSSNLKSLEGSAWYTIDHIVPIMQTNSCIPFLYCLSQYINNSSSSELKLTFLQHLNIVNYLSSLRKCENYYLISNWFTRTESFTIMNVLNISIAIKSQLDTSLFYDLAVKCLCVFNSEQKSEVESLLKNIIFSTQFYPSEILLKNLDINRRNTNLEVSLNNLDDILNVYIKVLGLNNNLPNFTSNKCLDASIGNVIPIDWIYTPIIVLYTNQQQNQNENEQIFIIKNCLRWILIYETYFPSLADTINPTDRYCRLACVFLGSDNLFLNQEIHELLENCFKNVVKFEKELNFNREIKGLTNFQDFYTQLLEQYQGVSYGDNLFGNVVLVPLAQKHNVQFRKTLWSEYMGVVQTFNVTEEQIMGSIQLYLEPNEEDLSLLMSYRRAIVNNSVRKHSVLYKIAKHHVEQFMLKRKAK